MADGKGVGYSGKLWEGSTYTPEAQFFRDSDSNPVLRDRSASALPPELTREIFLLGIKIKIPGYKK